MPGADKIPKMHKGITLQELQKLLGKCAFSSRYKDAIISIFGKVSKNDGILSAEDWCSFTTQIDKNKDGAIDDIEVNNALARTGLNKPAKGEKVKIDKNIIINFYNLIIKYISFNGGSLSENLTKRLESENLGNEIDAVSTKGHTTTVRYRQKNNLYSVVEYNSDTGEKEFEVIKNSKNEPVKIIEYKNEKPVSVIEYKDKKEIYTEYQDDGVTKKYESANDGINITETFFEKDKTITKKYLNNELVEISTLLKDGTITTESYKNGEIVSITKKKGNKTLSVEYYYDNKSSAEIKAEMDRIISEENAKNKKLVKQKDSNLVNRVYIQAALDAGLTWKQLEAYYSKTVLESILTSQNPQDAQTSKELCAQYQDYIYKLLKMTPQIYVAPEIQQDSILHADNCNTEEQDVIDDANIFYSADNSLRNGHNDAGYVNNWCNFDKYQSKDLNTFLNNLEKDHLMYDNDLGNKMSRAAHRLRNAEKGKEVPYQGQCAALFYKVVESVRNYQSKPIGLTRFGSAYMNAYQLSVNPNFREIPHNIVKTMTKADLKNLPVGTVIVYDAGYKKGGHSNGHITIIDKNGNTINGPNNGLYPVDDFYGNDDALESYVRMFIPVKPI